MRKLLEHLWSFLVMQLVHAIFIVIGVIQFAGFLYLGYLRVYIPISLTPGARDGMGLMVVMAAILVGALLLTGMVAGVEILIIKSFFPEWEPPED